MNLRDDSVGLVVRIRALGFALRRKSFPAETTYLSGHLPPARRNGCFENLREWSEVVPVG